MLSRMQRNPLRWVWQALTYKTKLGSTERIDENDNQYRRLRFLLRGSSGIYGQAFRRLDKFSNPKPLDQED
jgi:hypothetical protein